MTYEDYFKKLIQKTDKALKDILPPETQPPAPLHEAMRYAVFTGGKRFRPVMTLAACQACGADPETALLPAVSIELIHSYSLVHDDLPALDNDDLRRGNPTVHRKYGEAMAILAGDGLLTMAFRVLADVKPASRAVALLSEISTAAGTYGMIGGQVADLMTDPASLDIPTLDYINVHKTGKLIRASAVAGAISAGADKEARQRMHRYGEFIGLAFQAVDDFHDQDGYLRTMKPSALLEQIRDLIARAIKEVRPMGSPAQSLVKLAEFLLARVPKEISSHV